MADFSAKKLGKNLPQHKLMQNLLSNFPSKKKSKMAKSTQTIATAETCCCKKPQNSAIKKQISLLEANLIEKINGGQTQDFCSCSDSWSEGSEDGCAITFPRETRNAMAMLLNKKRSRTSGAWPGVAERTNGEMMAKITSKLSKNKLEMN